MAAQLHCELWEALWFLVAEWNKTETIVPALIIDSARQGKSLFFKYVCITDMNDTSNHAAC